MILKSHSSLLRIMIYKSFVLQTVHQKSQGGLLTDHNLMHVFKVNSERHTRIYTGFNYHITKCGLGLAGSFCLIIIRIHLWIYKNNFRKSTLSHEKNALPVFEDFYYILFTVKTLIQSRNRQNAQYPSIKSLQSSSLTTDLILFSL